MPHSGVAAPDARQDRRVEPELEFQHADADALGRQKMTEFVDEDEHAEHENERHNREHKGLATPAYFKGQIANCRLRGKVKTAGIPDGSCRIRNFSVHDPRSILPCAPISRACSRAQRSTLRDFGKR